MRCCNDNSKFRINIENKAGQV